MTSASRAAELRALADKIEIADRLKAESDDAKAAYRDALAGGDEEQIAEARQRHRDASQALADARSETRGDLVVATGTPGSATVRPGAVHAGPAVGEVG
jgi:hypothetical protein